MVPLLLYHILLIVAGQASASFCGTGAIPYRFDVLDSGHLILSCATPTCFGGLRGGIGAQNHNSSEWVDDNSGEVDGIIRRNHAGIETTRFRHKNAPEQRAKCEAKARDTVHRARTSCSENNSWVGGISFTGSHRNRKQRRALQIRCCVYDGMKFSTLIDEPQLTINSAYIGGEVYKNRRQIAFDVISDIKSTTGLDGNPLYRISVRRMPCIIDPVEHVNPIDGVVEPGLRPYLLSRMKRSKQFKFPSRGHNRGYSSRQLFTSLQHGGSESQAAVVPLSEKTQEQCCADPVSNCCQEQSANIPAAALILSSTDQDKCCTERVQECCHMQAPASNPVVEPPEEDVCCSNPFLIHHCCHNWAAYLSASAPVVSSRDECCSEPVQSCCRKTGFANIVPATAPAATSQQYQCCSAPIQPCCFAQSAYQCFSADTMVTTTDGEKRMDQLRIGDVVRSQMGNWSIFVPIISFLHRLPDTKATFIQIEVENGILLKLTPLHLIKIFTHTTASGRMVQAKDVKIGDRLFQLDKNSTKIVHVNVTKITVVEEIGAFAPLTSNAVIIVNDMVASCHSITESLQVQQSLFTSLRMIETMFWQFFGQYAQDVVELPPGTMIFASLMQYFFPSIPIDSCQYDHWC